MLKWLNCNFYKLYLIFYWFENFFKNIRDELEVENADLADEAQNRIHNYRKSDSQSRTTAYSQDSQDNFDIKKSNSFFVPSYFGESNAFAIQLFCIDEKFVSRSLDFLPKAFESFPDKDFCIITLPPSIPEFCLIQNFTVI
jgi:hypothetical protein